MNKKGGEKIFTIWWFFSVALIGLAIVIVITSYFGAPIDVRAEEVNMIYERIMGCAIQNGVIGKIIELDPNNDEIFEYCNLNEEQFKEGSDLFFNLTVYDSEGSIVKTFRKGKVSYEADCWIMQESKAAKYPVCKISKEKAIYRDSNSESIENWEIELIIASTNQGDKISIGEKLNG